VKTGVAVRSSTQPASLVEPHVITNRLSPPSAYVCSLPEGGTGAKGAIPMPWRGTSTTPTAFPFLPTPEADLVLAETTAPYRR
jgi:hypothetical protein